VSDEQLFRDVLVSSPESVSIYDLDSTVVWMNPATERMMGVPFAELCGKRLFELYPDSSSTPTPSAHHFIRRSRACATVRHRKSSSTTTLDSRAGTRAA
jgi:PAS domain S-box-containing protein